jgi:CheY-like chemotaxis protein
MLRNDGVALRGAPASRRVRLVDADETWRDLLGQWLGSLGCTVLPEPVNGGEPPAADLVIVDVPFPRQGGVDLVRRIASQHPATPILALSTNFFSGIECCGPVARALGVDCVLPKPATREALATAVRLVFARMT